MNRDGLDPQRRPCRYHASGTIVDAVLSGCARVAATDRSPVRPVDVSRRDEDGVYADTAGRPQPDLVVEPPRAGDTFGVTRWDRLGHGAGPLVAQQGVDPVIAGGRATAEFPRELITARGRRPRPTPHQAEVARQFHDGGKHTVQQVADTAEVPHCIVYGRLGPAGAGRPAHARTRPAGTRS